MLNLFVDGENTGTYNIGDLCSIKTACTLHIFYSSNVDFDIKKFRYINDIPDYIVIKYSNVSVGSKNALDFQLMSYVGYCIAKSFTGDTFLILSRDTGYDHTIDFWKKQGFDIARQDSLSPKNERTRMSATAITKFMKKHHYNDRTTEFVLSAFKKAKSEKALRNQIDNYFHNTSEAGMIFSVLKPLYLKNK